MRIVLAQFPIEAAAVEANTERALAEIGDAASRGADLVALPEIFNVGYFAFDAYARHAEPLDGETLGLVRNAAIEQDVAVLAGSIVEDLSASAAAGFDTLADEGYANTAVLFDSGGNRRAVYRKHHLFGYGSAEQNLLVPGQSIQTADVGGFTVGVTTCYDLRFPELYRDLVDAGVTLALVPGAWPYPRVEHWKLFARTRAVENQLYVGAVNGVGSFDDATLLGRSAVYDPWGTTVASASDEETLVMADIDPARVEEVRDEFPALADRR
jgi:predicted amidohydrolase